MSAFGASIGVRSPALPPWRPDLAEGAARNWRKGSRIKYGRWTENRNRKGALPRSRALTEGPVTRIEVRPYWPSDDVRQIAKRCGVRPVDLMRLLEEQGFMCALCNATLDPWRKVPRIFEGSPEELVCVGCLARLRLVASQDAVW